MRAPGQSRTRLWAFAVAIVAFAGIAVWLIAFRQPAEVREFSAVRVALEQSGSEMSEAEMERLAERCLEIGRKHPGTASGVSAQLTAATLARKTSAGAEAHQEFARQIETADVGALAQAFDWSLGQFGAISDLAPAILARARTSPDHPRAGRLLAAVCAATRPREAAEPPAIYAEAADLIAERAAGSPDICHFCEGLGGAGTTPPWAGRFERHLRAILRVNRHRAVRCSAQFALASVVQSTALDRQDEALGLYEQFCAQFDGKHSYSYRGIEAMLGKMARGQINELKFRAVGKIVPDIKGIDLDGRAMTLSEYRGRTVLLSFWATWCFPCMELIPHEKELVAHFKDQPFAIVGVNCDSEIEKARDAVSRNAISWQSFRNRSDSGQTISGDWKIVGYPTLYLIDHHGTIRRRWIGGPSPDELLRVTEALVGAARDKLAPEAMPAVVAAIAPPSANSPSAAMVDTAAGARPGTGFLVRTYRDERGSESKYGLFVPRSYDGRTPTPAILFLHGAGSRGSDGRGQMDNSLAKAIRRRNGDFRFLVIFPQAREDENWTAENAGGKRAIAILNEVQSDYRVDPKRICLTGLSMGGEGTWSLAAADPGRWCAIVPICHGWKPSMAARLKDVPIWCFHGDADEMIPASQSREMISAIQATGGKPLYQEVAGAGHNDCADRVYAMPELYEWILGARAD